MEIFNAIMQVLPALGGLIGGLIQMGHSADEAAEIVKRDITSRLAEYEAAKAEDMAALARKHGR